MEAKRLIRCAATFALLALGLTVPASATADTFTVTDGRPSGAGSLRQAIADANARPGRDTIDFDPSVSDVFLSFPGEATPEITDDVDIAGPGASNLDVDGADSRAFAVKSSATVTISGMTIEGSEAFDDAAGGGAMLNDGALTLVGVTFHDNLVAADSAGDARGGAIANRGTLTLRNSLLTGNDARSIAPGRAFGGAIFNSGTMTIDHSQVREGEARVTDHGDTDGGDSMGGAIANGGDLRIVDSTLAKNTTRGADGRDRGGDGLGGAIYNYGDGRLTVESSTIVGNTAVGGDEATGIFGVSGIAVGGGIENAGSAAFSIRNSTVTANRAQPTPSELQRESHGGGIDDVTDSQRQSTILGTTISGNSARVGSNLADSGASLGVQDSILAGSILNTNCGPGDPGSRSIKSLGYNIDSGSSCGFNASGDRSGTDPRLKPLAVNGGPTQTMAIGLSSPAIDQGVSGGLTTDQRGEKRPVIVPGVPRPAGGDGSDIGAYEYQPSQGGHHRIKGSVKPGRTHAGERTCFKFKAKRPTGAPMKKVQVKFAGKRARTDQRGKATICKRFKDSGVRHPRLRKRGHERAKLKVRVRP
jgi:hypothetical protein